MPLIPEAGVEAADPLLPFVVSARGGFPDSAEVEPVVLDWGAPRGGGWLPSSPEQERVVAASRKSPVQSGVGARRARQTVEQALKKTMTTLTPPAFLLPGMIGSAKVASRWVGSSPVSWHPSRRDEFQYSLPNARR